MGTNYYLWTKEEKPRIETIDEGMHIGKNSCGWVFHFQANPILEISNLNDMKEITKQGKIYDEYCDYFTYDDFWKIVKDSKKDFNGRKPYVLKDPNHPSDYDFGNWEEEGYAWSNNEFS